MSDEEVEAFDDGTMYVRGELVTETMPIAHGPQWTVFVAVTETSKYILQYGVGRGGQYINILSEVSEDFVQGEKLYAG